ncbi:uncharacterized protein STEHIDRAFT_146977 [Stereum hirsutum FP-91666 SS1]|uniref:uncharacterized protein n=1 Tax=Stereum hirsutum (strain FP-91666) TaxID=721885 RepID=UPI000440CDCD|nr:uncharacterized protein STEHIDRAFT_146977 [Stereum hirsutum FP-91666 SS1]EIM87677.1 hypothetical protein STEHIDRAFT_146977 [Stereum hirsutum FP-91666 SS1]
MHPDFTVKSRALSHDLPCTTIRSRFRCFIAPEYTFGEFPRPLQHCMILSVLYSNEKQTYHEHGLAFRNRLHMSLRPFHPRNPFPSLFLLAQHSRTVSSESTSIFVVGSRPLPLRVLFSSFPPPLLHPFASPSLPSRLASSSLSPLLPSTPISSSISSTVWRFKTGVSSRGTSFGRVSR